MSAIGWREHDNYILSWVVGESSNTIGKPRAKKTEEENGSTERTGKRNINYSYFIIIQERERQTKSLARMAVKLCWAVLQSVWDKDTGCSHVEEEEKEPGKGEGKTGKRNSQRNNKIKG